MTIFTGTLGEVSRGPARFKAEIRSLASALNQARGRLYTRSCDALFGDRRCGIDATSAAYRGTGTVARILSGRSFATAGLAAFATGWFSAGTLAWTSGRNAGAVQIVRAHGGGAEAILDLWEPTGAAMAAGDAFTVTAGCDKSFDTCRTRFANAANFRGFPHLPPPEYGLTYAVQGADNDGGALV